MGRRRIFTLLLIIILAAGAAALLTAFGIGGGKQHEAAPAKKGSIAGIIKESGDIEGEKDQVYFARVSAPVKSVDLKVGDLVKAGEVLLTYDTEDLERTVSEASINREQSEANAKGQIDRSNEYSAKYSKAASDDAAYAQLYALEREYKNSQEEGQYKEDWDINRRRDSINSSIASKNETIAEKKKDIAKSDDLDEIEELNEDIAELNEDIASLEKEKASLPTTERTPGEYETYNDTSNWMEDITRNWKQAVTEKNNYESAILNKSQKNALEKQTDLARSREEEAAGELEKALDGVKADFSGIVTECGVKSGNVVTEGTPLFKIVSDKDMKVTVMISKYDIGQIKEGLRAEVEIADAVFPGTVTRINHVATKEDSDKNKVAVDVHIDDPDERVILGLEADVTIFTEEKMGVLEIPYAGFYSDDDGDYCYVIEDGVIAKKYVTAGIKTTDKVEITGGLSEGDIVITDSVTDSQIGEKATYAVH